VALGEVLTFFGAVADYAAGNAPEEGGRVASLATAVAHIAGLPQSEIDALYFAARLRNIGALGNAAFAKAQPLSEREAAMQRWDIPAQGARICERIDALPKATADIVRWQAECWDGTGYPDQLRWSGVPRTAQILHIAVSYARHADSEDALAAITTQSGRTFAPDQTRAFVTWFHTTGGEIETAAPPYAALNQRDISTAAIIERLSELVDAHNGTPGRAQRIARRCEEIGKQLACAAEDVKTCTLAAQLFGIGELRAPELEAASFDALGRLGIEMRAERAAAASQLIAQCPQFASAAGAVGARAEWFDGTGLPNALRGDAIPIAARILSAALAHDALDESYRTRITQDRTLPIVRLETAAGTQFDPAVVRALSEVVKARV
jgi:response regulator RpfG family c-di-GMP phosphodiesterase